mmetsp:Transcript_14711/g.55444  ORF Transcript_14711/g.55444 Transcript_14711/m.55444 type:complete len:264 (+) Transcript_14711:595-1386(+)
MVQAVRAVQEEHPSALDARGDFRPRARRAALRNAVEHDPPGARAWGAAGPQCPQQRGPEGQVAELEQPLAQGPQPARLGGQQGPRAARRLPSRTAGEDSPQGHAGLPSRHGAVRPRKPGPGSQAHGWPSASSSRSAGGGRRLASQRSRLGRSRAASCSDHASGRQRGGPGGLRGPFAGHAGAAGQRVDADCQLAVCDCVASLRVVDPAGPARAWRADTAAFDGGRADTWGVGEAHAEHPGRCQRRCGGDSDVRNARAVCGRGR